MPPSAEKESDNGPKSVFVDDEVEPQVLQVIRSATKHKYQDKDFVEKYCHSCGKNAKTTFAKPLCMACWKKSN